MCWIRWDQDEDEDEGEIDFARASEAAFAEVWDNEEDAIYDRWRELYGVAEDESPSQNDP